MGSLLLEPAELSGHFGIAVKVLGSNNMPFRGRIPDLDAAAMYSPQRSSAASLCRVIANLHRYFYAKSTWLASQAISLVLFSRNRINDPSPGLFE